MSGFRKQRVVLLCNDYSNLIRDGFDFYVQFEPSATGFGSGTKAERQSDIDGAFSFENKNNGDIQQYHYIIKHSPYFLRYNLDSKTCFTSS
jgi:hypothetical protein